ncbi:SprT-like family protein [Melissococcus plutonius]|uniref:Protein SprT-like n=1 Tax=Melissococcus plutonius (strain ATCC 35311 / DSM 29964 / CIP 104052 / LMG 20360 / NCIMB 702443) TaxID=940190 RepID=F3YB41_MELPT|nr:SprT family protein [Melissococcus plutonius]AIM25144.1 SprT-like family protein [Melissococcus plutonius S1]KMT25399.1 SprT-like family protein [Melissococcus plutonius]KMT25439.1 SprT-like family protein [Melissococcus plutonius]KMT26303.1 SprT-like family protein [Melissococcus plutonius]KMT29045.1 SprT-like family protein [Melissococcus plutonius]
MITKEKIITNEPLQLLVEKISNESFNQSFSHMASFNYRLKTTGGRYYLASHNLEFNPKIIDRYGIDELIKVIKHELCHYHLHLAGKGYKHKDKEFKRLLKQTGGSRFVPPLIDEKAKSLHHYECEQCRTTFLRKRKLNTERFVCGKCGGHLILRQNEFS